MPVSSGLDAAIYQALLTGANPNESFMSNFGESKYFYIISLGDHHFTSEKVDVNGKLLQWTETFTFSGNQLDKVLNFEIFIENTVEGVFSVDNFELKLAELDRNNAQLKKLKHVSDKDNAYDLFLKWRKSEIA